MDGGDDARIAAVDTVDGPGGSSVVADAGSDAGDADAGDADAAGSAGSADPDDMRLHRVASPPPAPPPPPAAATAPAARMVGKQPLSNRCNTGTSPK